MWYATGLGGLSAMASRKARAALRVSCYSILLRHVPRALSQQLLARVARLRGAPGLLLRRLASPLLHHLAILHPLPKALHLLVLFCQ